MQRAFHRLRPARLTPCVSAAKASQPQQGMTLLELLVGISLGAMVIAAALGTLLVSKAVTGTTDELARMQQDATFALAVMGRLIRQAGALEPVQSVSAAGLPRLALQERALPIVTGKQGAANAADSVLVGTQSGSRAGVHADCFGNTIAAREFSTAFSVNSSQQLMCETQALGANRGSAQALIANVRDFRVQYRIAQRDAAGRERLHTSRIPPPSPTGDTAPRVIAVELCLELEGLERIQGANGHFINCQGESVRMAQRLRRVYRNVFYLRAS